MSEAKRSEDAIAGFGPPPFAPILTDARSGHTFTMLGTTMRLIATAAGTGGRFTVIEQLAEHGSFPSSVLIDASNNVQTIRPASGWFIARPSSPPQTCRQPPCQLASAQTGWDERRR